MSDMITHNLPGAIVYKDQKQCWTKKFVQHYSKKENPQLGDVFEVEPSGRYYKIIHIATVGYYDYYHCIVVEDDIKGVSIEEEATKVIPLEQRVAALEGRIDTMEHNLLG
jgi:hypothetical protein